jgi:ADP-ribose pyrophosphatase YjhB (NUDIX family)
MGGHVAAGETYEQSALREILEELNLMLRPEDLEFVRKFRPAELPYFRTVYLYRSNKAPDYNPEDFVGAEWLSPLEIIQRIDAGVPAKLSLRETVEYLQAVDGRAGVGNEHTY